jgi:CubicO group peptidase (beta-lactamase class C family)
VPWLELALTVRHPQSPVSWHPRADGHPIRTCHKIRLAMRRPTLAAAIAVLAVATATNVAGRGQPPPLQIAAPESIGLAPATLTEATALLRQYVADGKIAGAVAAVARKGSVGYLEAVGVQDLQTRSPMTSRTLFRIYSMAKPVTAVAVMMLHDEGKFRLDDPVSKYLPEFAAVTVVDSPGAAPRPPARPVTVEDLLLHTSGLSHRTSELYRTLGVRSRADTLAVFIGKITRAPLMEDPHTRFRYSEATTVLGRLVEIWSGTPFDQFLKTRLFTPLGMSDTMFWVEPAQRDRLATVYGPAPGGGLTAVEVEAVPFTERPALLEGAVGLVSTVPDYLRFSQMLLDGGTLGGVRVLKADTVARMTANGLPPAVQAARGGSMGWGLANVNVLLTPGASGASVGEYGWDGTAGTIFWVDPRKQTVIVLMTQSAPANPDSLRQRFKAIVQRAIE